MAHALLALAASLTAREQPGIDEAAAVAGKIVGMLDTRRTASVSDRTASSAPTPIPHAGLSRPTVGIGWRDGWR
ncbi:hypothetical protein [Parafrankia sp. FMc2]|uniref:hypothetical protein n=1 Tax=Parafrankia sp. FMc2 TaxID=3233196 RepID=UPI0034D585BE